MPLDRRIGRRVAGLGVPLVRHGIVPQAVGVVGAISAGRQDILVHPSHAGGIGADLRAHARRQFALDVIQPFQHAAAGPVQVGAVLKDNINETGAEQAEAAHHLGPGHGQHGLGQRIGDLVLDDFWGLAGVVGQDDDLHVGKVGNRVDLDVEHRPHARDDQEDRQQHDHRAVPDAPIDEPGDHLLTLTCAAMLSAFHIPGIGGMPPCGGAGSGAGGAGAGVGGFGAVTAPVTGSATRRSKQPSIILP